MAVIENCVQIECTPEDAFDYLVDLRHELEWNPAVQSMEKVTEGPIGVGTKFLAKWKQSGWIEVACMKFDRPRAWSYSSGAPLSIAFDATVTPTGAGVLLTVHFDVRPKGPVKLIFPLLLFGLKRSEKQNMQFIKQALDRKRVARG